MKHYYLLYTFPNNKRVHVMHHDERVLIAEEGNEKLLLDMAKKFLDQNLIGSFQLAEAIGPALSKEEN